MTTNNITQFFPTTDKIKEPRPQQIELYDKIIALFKAGKKEVNVCAPTGIGKSPLGILLANAFASHGKRTLITSPLNELVDQYDRDFGEQYLSTIKGRKHYTCNANPDRTCDIGYCQEKACGIDQTQRLCQNIATADLCKRRDECPCMSCIYSSAMKKYKSSTKGNTNFTLFQKGVTNDPDLIIIDEADSVEDFVRMNFSVTVPEIIDWDDFSDHIFSLQDWKDIYQKNIETATHHMQNSKNPHQRMELSRTIKSLKSKCVNVSRIINDYDKHGEDWAITNNDFKGTTLYQPVLTDRFLEPLLKNKYVIQMSATPPNLPNYEYLEVDSPFPPEIRQWKYKPLGRMSLKYREQTIPKVSKFLCSLKGKTLVHCYDKQTRVLTQKGFKYFKDIKPTDLIATLSKNGLLEYQHPIKIINYNYIGDMVSFKNTRLDLLVTPEHRMYISSIRGDDNFGYTFKTANQLKEGVKINGFKTAKSFKIKKWCKWTGVLKNYWTIPAVTVRSDSKKLTPPHNIPIKIWLRFLGWYISEGSTNYREDISQYQVQIGQKNIENTDIPSLIKEMGYHGYIQKYTTKTTFGTTLAESIIITDKALTKYLRDTFGVGSYNKHLTEEILDLPPHLLKEFIDTYSQGDGHVRDKYIQMYTSSTILKDQLIEIGLKIGCQSNVGLITSEYWNKLGRKTCDMWIIGFSHENRHAIIKPNDIETQSYNGLVGCVEVPNSIIFVERNGKSAWCGNCVSYATAEAIGRSIMSLCDKTPLIQTGKKLPYDYNCSGLVGRVDAVERFKKSDNLNEILLSVKMDRGVDFWENDITNNVIGVMPWPNPTDPVVKAKNKLLGESWKNQNMANIIMQSYGRINRNANKTTMTYIIDTNFSSWFGKNKSCFKKWYLEAQVK